MKCPTCGEAELIQDSRDMPYTYQGETTVIPGVTGEFCPACGEAILGMKESQRTIQAMRELKKYVMHKESRESFKQDALASWAAYQETGQHLTEQEVRDWLNTWDMDDKRNQAKLDALRAAIIAGENSGDPVPLDIEQLIRELKQKILRPPHE